MSRARKHLGLALTLVALATLALLLGNRALTTRHRASFERALAEVPPGELEPGAFLPDLPREDDAAYYFPTIIAALENGPRPAALDAPSLGAIGAPGVAEAVAFVASSAAVQSLEAAVARSRTCTWDFDFFLTDFYPRLQRVLATGEARAGRGDEALAHLERGLAYERRLVHPAVAYARAVEVPLLLEPLGPALAERPSAAACARVLAQLDDLDLVRDRWLATRWRRARLARLLAANEQQPERTASELGIALPRGWLLATRVCPWLERRDAESALERASRAVERARPGAEEVEPLRDPRPSGWSRPFTRALGFSGDPPPERAQAEVDTARAALGVALFRARHGRLPSTLDELPPAERGDGRASYRVTKGGYEVAGPVPGVAVTVER